jgi:hypothetical protein
VTALQLRRNFSVINGKFSKCSVSDTVLRSKVLQDPSHPANDDDQCDASNATSHADAKQSALSGATLPVSGDVAQCGERPAGKSVIEKTRKKPTFLARRLKAHETEKPSRAERKCEYTGEAGKDGKQRSHGGL